MDGSSVVRRKQSQAKIVDWKEQCWVLFPDDRDVDGISTLPSAGVSRIWEDDGKPCLPNLFTPPSPSRIFSCSDQYTPHVAGAGSEQFRIDFTIFPHIKTRPMPPKRMYTKTLNPGTWLSKVVRTTAHLMLFRSAS